MRIPNRKVLWCLTAALTALSLLACGADTETSAKTSASQTPTPTAATAVNTTTAIAAPLTQGPRTEKWVALEVGDCLVDLPPTDPSVVTVAVVDCATAHLAEVYFRAAVGVNAAIADVANRECDIGFSQYTEQSVDGSPFSVTYLID